MTVLQVIESAGLGLLAGILGGLAGIGGSMVMLPGLHLFLGEDSPSTHHRYMAAAMTVNVLVALPAAWRHWKAGAVRWDLLGPVLSSAIVGITAGVLLSNLVRGDALRMALAIFLLIYCASNLWVLYTGKGWAQGHLEQSSKNRLLWSGLATGLVAGILGLGGGVVLVPMLQILCRVPLKQAIATSSAVICVTAVTGASLKLTTLEAVGESWVAALKLAAILAPTAMIGGYFGAGLTHRMAVRGVRIIVTTVLLLMAGRLLFSPFVEEEPPTEKPPAHTGAGDEG